MKNQIKTKVAAVIIGVGLIGCSSSAQTTEGNTSAGQNNERPQRGEDRKMLSADEVFAQMDANNDGKLAKDEVSGPLKNDFAKIDTNGDAFISKEELEKAPKPKGGRPPRRN